MGIMDEGYLVVDRDPARSYRASIRAAFGIQNYRFVGFDSLPLEIAAKLAKLAKLVVLR
jgi:hypothetical protein